MEHACLLSNEADSSSAASASEFVLLPLSNESHLPNYNLRGMLNGPSRSSVRRATASVFKAHSRVVYNAEDAAGADSPFRSI